MPIIPTILLSVVCTWSGCSSLPMMKGIVDHVPTESRKMPIVEIMAVWQPGEGKNTNGIPARGFAGQIFFFAQGSKTPVKVDGDLKVYVFDDLGTVEEQSKPMHIFEFKEGSILGYYHESKLGPAYQLFLPYTRPGTHEAKCTLRLKYTSKDSGDVLSSESTIVLAGKKIAKITDPKPSDVSLASGFDVRACEAGDCQTKTEPNLRGGTGIELLSHEEPLVQTRVGTRVRTEPKVDEKHPLKVLTLTPERSTTARQTKVMEAFESHMLSASSEQEISTPAKKRSSVSGHPLLQEQEDKTEETQSFDAVFGES